MSAEMKNGEAGFTIQELLVVLLVGSFLVSFSLSLLLFAGKLFSSWERAVEVRRTLHRTLAWLDADIRKGVQVEWLGDSLFAVHRRNGRRVEYRFAAGGATRDSIPLVSADGPTIRAALVDSLTLRLQSDWRGRSHAVNAAFLPERSSESEIAKELEALRGPSSWEASKRR